jgi:hypothetical protein
MRAIRLLATSLLVGLILVPGFASAQGGELQLLEPMESAVILGDSIQVIFDVAGIKVVPSNVPVEEAGKRPDANRADEGHLHLMLDLQPVVIWDKLEPYTFTNVPPGNHLLMVEVVNNDHSSRTPPLVVQRNLMVQAGNGAPPSSTLDTLPDTAVADVLTTPAGRFLLLLTALLLINVGSMVRVYQKSLLGSASNEHREHHRVPGTGE